MSGIERRLRETEQELQEVKQRWKDAEKAKDETEGIARTAEAAIKQVFIAAKLMIGGDACDDILIYCLID